MSTVDLSYVQYQTVVNVFSLTIAVTGSASIFFLLKRQEVLPRYRTAVTLLGLVSLVAAYNYLRLTQSWREAYQVVNGGLVRTEVPYDDLYRYADWMMTVPLLLVALVLALDLPLRQSRLRITILGLLAVEMIVFGYVGHVADARQDQWLWWSVAMVPFLIIVQQLYFGLAAGVRKEPQYVQRLISIVRLITVVTWTVYPGLYLLPLFVPVSSTALVATQLGYAAADMTAKAVFGLFICRIVQSKSDATALATAPAAR